MKSSFTLVEVLIVILIIGILAGLGIPQFFKTKERALGDEAIVNLKLIAAAERIYRMENNSYYGPTPDFNNINTNLKLSLVGTNWTYTIPTATASTFAITADRVGTGGFLNCEYTLTNTDADGEPNPNVSCP